MPSNDSRTIIDALLRRKPAPRMGIMEKVWADTLRQWTQQGYPVNADGTPADQIETLGLDMDCVGGWFDVMPLLGFEELIEENDQWAIKRNGAGATLKRWKNRSGAPEHMDFRMTSREAWDRDYRPHLLAADRKRIDFARPNEALPRRRENGRWAYYGHLFVWENMRQSMGDLCLYESLLLDPAWVHDYCRVYTDFFKAHYKLMFDECGLPDGIWMFEDMGYKNGLFCSPKTFEELIFPYFREIIEFFHSYDLPVVLHSCGGINAAMDMIVEVGFDALNPMEIKAGMDPLALADKYGDKLAFIGGMDVRVLESGDKDIIQREVKRLTDGMRSRGARYIFASDHSVSTNVTYASYRYALDAFRDNCSY